MIKLCYLASDIKTLAEVKLGPEKWDKDEFDVWRKAGYYWGGVHQIIGNKLYYKENQYSNRKTEKF